MNLIGSPPVAGGFIVGLPLTVGCVAVLFSAMVRQNRRGRLLLVGWLLAILNIGFQSYFILTSMYGIGPGAERMMKTDLIRVAALWLTIPLVCSLIVWKRRSCQPSPPPYGSPVSGSPSGAA